MSEVDYSKSTMDKYNDAFRAKMAVHNGGPLGVGAGHSVMRARLTHPESDYLFSLVVEELGSIIAFIIILLYLWIFFRSIEICRRCTTAFPTLMTAGLGLLITCQAMLHILVQVNLIPETGQTLPLISRGGSSLLFMSLALGMIISVSRTTSYTKKQ